MLCFTVQQYVFFGVAPEIKISHLSSGWEKEFSIFWGLFFNDFSFIFFIEFPLAFWVKSSWLGNSWNLCSNVVFFSSIKCRVGNNIRFQITSNQYFYLSSLIDFFRTTFRQFFPFWKSTIWNIVTVFIYTLTHRLLICWHVFSCFRCFTFIWYFNNIVICFCSTDFPKKSSSRKIIILHKFLNTFLKKVWFLFAEANTSPLENFSVS